jgi:hypothetical protein
MKKSSTSPIQDKAEVSIDFPDKFYMGSFPSDAKFEARSEDDGLFIKLIKMGENRRQVEIHLHHYLLADILSEWAVSLANEPPMQEDHRERLLAALAQVENTLR